MVTGGWSQMRKDAFYFHGSTAALENHVLFLAERFNSDHIVFLNADINVIASCNPNVFLIRGFHYYKTGFCSPKVARVALY